MPPECAEGRPSAHCKINNIVCMKAEYKIKALPGDEVWIALEGGPYKTKIKGVNVYIQHLSEKVAGGWVKYEFDLPGKGRCYHAYNSLICMTKEEAQKKLDMYKEAGEGTKEFLRIFYEEQKGNEVKVIGE